MVHLFLSMDPDVLLNVGRASDRLYQLVGDKRVWRRLLKRIEAFTAERVKQLALYLEKTKSQEMRQEVLREPAHRLKEQIKRIPYSY